MNAPAAAAALIERARALAPTLRERAEKANELRRLPDETIADLHDAGFFRILQPARYGGFEMDPQVFFEVQIALGAACPSTAWVLGVMGVHQWQMALFAPQAQDEVWGQDSTVLISSSYMPVGKVTPVDGGYQLSGRWGYSSGSDHCQWVFLGAFVPTADGPPDMRTFLVPRADYRLEDTWHVSGLQGTGSQDVVIEGCFVPEHRTHRFRDGFICQSPGHAVNDAPLYKLPFGQLFVRSVSTPALGIATGALEIYKEAARSRFSRADASKAKDDMDAQRVAARAAAVIVSEKQILMQNFDTMMAQAGTGERISIEARVQYRYQSAETVRRCQQAVYELFCHSGSSAIFLSNPINRYMQDMLAARGHFANHPSKPGANWGRVQFGQSNRDFFI